MKRYSRPSPLLGSIGAALALALCGCHHPSKSGPRQTAAARVFDGDPATNVMVVPASAMWRARGGATNLVASGIVPGSAFPFPDYDEPLVKSVYGRWLELLKAQPQPAAHGVVVVEFLLQADGSVSRLRTLPSEVTPRLEQLCEQAILELAPFPKWPALMRSEIGSGIRAIRVAFDFNAGGQARAAVGAAEGNTPRR